jgi:hypothetical protein
MVIIFLIVLRLVKIGIRIVGVVGIFNFWLLKVVGLS